MAANRSTISVATINNRAANLKAPTETVSPLHERLRVSLFDQRRMENEISHLRSELDAEQTTCEGSNWQRGFAASPPVVAALKLSGQPVDEYWDLRKTRQYALGNHEHAEIMKTAGGQCFAWLRNGGFREITDDLYNILRARAMADLAIDLL
jgi:hypothetical protein